MSKEILLVTDKVELDRILSEPDRRLVLVYFWAPWAHACTTLDEVLNEMVKHKDFEKITFVRNGKEMDRLEGAHPAELTKKSRLLASCFIPPVTVPLENAQERLPGNLASRLKSLINSSHCMLFMKGTRDNPCCRLKTYSNWPTYPQLYIDGELIGGHDIVKEMAASGQLKTRLCGVDKNEKLEKLINSHPIMLFMKGSPSEPQCGFSRSIVAILNEAKVDYGTFDILQDEEVRTELKEYSKWPTYPQLYVKGKLIGGLDIVKELKESGELTNALSVA